MVMMINDVNDDLDNDHADDDGDHGDVGHLHHGGEVVVPRLGREPLTLPAGGKQHLVNNPNNDKKGGDLDKI